MRTSRTIMVQNSRTPGTLIHGNQLDGSNLTFGRVSASIDFSRPIRPKWSGTAGLTYQHAGARDEKGNPIIRDFFSSPLTASGNSHDEMLLAKLETVYTDSGDCGSSMLKFNMEQGLPLLPDWLFFNRMNFRARQDLEIGLAHFLFSVSGGHVFGNFPPHEAFAIGGTNSVRGYEEGAVGSGRSYAVGSEEISFPLVGPVGVYFLLTMVWILDQVQLFLAILPELGCRLGSPLGLLRLEYAFNDKGPRFHFGVGHQN